jgi:23S rRNA (adenine2503-C2)-methyltransferase
MDNLIFKQHVSQLDQSVNFEHRFEDHPGMLEARYVRRVDEYFIVYLSSQTGCNQACRMCWLTATGQNKLRDTTIEEFWQQADEVLRYYADKHPAKMVHFNFMARGEPLANKIFLSNADEILRGLKKRAARYGLESKFLISTIMPEEFSRRSLESVFTDPTVYPEIYYSVYSLSDRFRRRWLPKAGSPRDAFSILKDWQLHTGKVPKIHYAFIEHENDNLADVKAILDVIDGYQLEVNWNIVRYNPPEGHYSREPVEGHIDYLHRYIKRRLPNARVKLIPRVGTDVQASCGTFLK